MTDTTTPTAPGYFARHIFFCLNERPNGEACCAQHGAKAAFEHCKALVKEAGLAGPGQVRVGDDGHAARHGPLGHMGGIAHGLDGAGGAEEAQAFSLGIQIAIPFIAAGA